MLKQEEGKGGWFLQTCSVNKDLEKERERMIKQRDLCVQSVQY